MLDVEALRKAYGSFQLGPLDLAVGEEVLAVLGPSGCGKTTLLSAIAGVTEADDGTVTLAGTNLTDRPPEQRGAALVFQDGALFPHMSVRDNIEYAAVPSTDIDRITGTLDIQDIQEQRAGTLSGGEVQRVALARALAADPAALLLDEPLANLDTPTKRRLRDALRELLAALSIPVVYVTHDQTEASSIGDRLAVMRDGQIEQRGPPRTVFARPETAFVARFTGATNLFRAVMTDRQQLHWASHQLETTSTGHESGDEVWFCIRPEYVEIIETATDRRENAIETRITEQVFEGGTYRLWLSPTDSDTLLEVPMRASEYERRNLGEGDRLTVTLPADAVHVIGD
jgi:molybdate/tungstate transport system ATP-binding protein